MADNLLVQILEEKRSFLQPEWDRTIAGWEGEGRSILPAADYDLLLQQARNEDSRRLGEALHEVGWHVADRGRSAEQLVAEALKFTGLLHEAIPPIDGGGSREALSAVDRLQSEILAALVGGFVAARNELIAEQSRWMSELNRRNARLLEQSDKKLLNRVSELAALHRINSAANSSLDLEAMLNLTVEAVAEVMKADICSIYMYEEDRDSLVLRATKGLNPEAVGEVLLKIGEGVTGYAAEVRQTMVIPDVWAEPRYRRIPRLHEELCKSLLSVPIVLFNKAKLVGVMNIETLASRDFTEEEIRFTEVVAGEVAISIENARLYQQTDEKLQQKVSELTTLKRVSATIAATLDHRQVLNLVVSQAMELMKADKASIFALNKDTLELSIIAHRGLGKEYVEKMRVPLGEAVVGQVVATGMPLSVQSTEDYSLSSPQAQEAFWHEGCQSIASVPLNSPRGALGALCVYSHVHRVFDEEEVELLSAFANDAALALENASLYEETRRGLAIKSALLKEMHHRVRNNLQTVGALLSMQLRRARSTPAEKPLSESVSRIQSIAAIHDLLCQDDAESTTVYEVARRIVENAILSLKRPNIRLKFQLEEDHVIVGSKEASLLAILINELVANAILHGLIDRKEGLIAIRACNENGKTIVEVRDNGRGFPPDFDLKNDAGLGLHIVQTLVAKDLEGTLELTSKAGETVTRIMFPGYRGDDGAASRPLSPWEGPSATPTTGHPRLSN